MRAIRFIRVDPRSILLGSLEKALEMREGIAARISFDICSMC